MTDSSAMTDFPATTDSSDRARRFSELHERDEPFLLPNPWDAGTARILESLGFEALATTSLGVTNAMGVAPSDGALSLDAVIENCRVICEATTLPVNADLENGFADDPREAARAIERAAEVGAAGGSIEDHTGRSGDPIYDFELAVERVHAAVEVARALPSPFVLTARAENHLHGRSDLDDTIRRLQAFEQVGADVLYAPGLRTLEQIRTLVGAVGKPVNVVMGFVDPTLTLADLSGVGVRRVSIGGALSRIALDAFIAAAREMREGRFGFVGRIPPLAELLQHFDSDLLQRLNGDGRPN
jgi:2-methylisocitrate lyase-like PEP mutase family enzyme